MADFKSGEDPFASNTIAAGVDPFASQPAQPQPKQSAYGTLSQTLGPSDFTKSFASTPARMLKSAMQIVGAGDYVPDAVSNAAAEGDKSTLGRIAGDVAGTSGIGAGAGALVNTIQKLNASRSLPAAFAKAAGTMGYGATQGAITSPDQQEEAAKWGALGSAVVPAAGGLVKTLGKVSVPILGMTTGAGGESVKQAFKGGPEFVGNMRGNVEPSVVVDAARQGVQNMRQSMRDAYTTAKGGWAGDTTQLPFQPIVQAADAAAAKFSFRGVPQPGVEGVKQQVEGALQHWMDEGAQNPAFFTVEGLDAFKRHLQDIVPDNVANRTGRAYVTEVVNGVKEAITKQAPQYADAMKDYWARSNELDEITRSLSLGDKATVDTTLRKLQSLTRNNVSTNYGQRLVSADALKQAGADVMPAIAGQAMNTWTPRGLAASTAAGGGGIAALLNPVALAALPAFSPRIVGEGARAVGAVASDPRTVATLRALRMAGPSAVRTATRQKQDE